MPRYRFEAINPQGTLIYGERDAPGRAAVIDYLQQGGHLPKSVEEMGGIQLWAKAGSLAPWIQRRQESGDIFSLTQELAIILHAGVPLDQALTMTETASITPRSQRMVQRIREHIRGGAPFSEALRQEGEVFSALYISMVRAGEAAGTLGHTLEHLANHLERNAQLRAAVISALIYPTVLVVVALMTVIMLMAFVIPQFIPLFEDAGVALPWLTQTLFAASALIRRYWWVGVAGVAGITWFFNRWLDSPHNRKKFDGACLRIPLAGMILRYLETARLGNTLGVLMAQGIPLLAALRLTQETIKNRALAIEVEQVADAVTRGESISVILHTSPNVPKRAIQLIEIGERSGQLPEMLRKVGDIYDREAQTQIKRLVTLIEPILILGLGGLIAVIISSVLLAVLELNNLIV